MFSKLLKYDSRAVLKYWWIGAVASVFIAVLGGLCIKIITVDYTAHENLLSLGVVGLMFSCIGIYIFPVLTTVLVLIRFYKHFFTDEGYLTFTLPVKRTTLIYSKLVSGLVFSLATAIIMILDFLLMAFIGEPNIFTDQFAAQEFIYYFAWGYFIDVYSVADVVQYAGVFFVPYIILSVLIAVTFIVANILLAYVCISFASAITKRHKVITAIGIYYGVSTAATMLVQILAVGGLATVSDLIEKLSYTFERVAVLFMLIGILGMIIVVISGFYLLLLYLLDKRLNLE